MYFGGGMIPNYVLMTYLGLRDTVAAFILPGLIGTYYVLLMKSFFAGIPRELEEAGSIDGLTHIGIFFQNRASIIQANHGNYGTVLYDRILEQLVQCIPVSG